MHFFLERYDEAYKTEIKDFIKNLENDTQMSVSGFDGLQSLKIGLAAIKSLQLNRPVNLNEIK